MRTLFLSYSRADRPLVQRIVQRLENRGFDLWWDHELLTGSNYIVEINKRLRTADSVVVVWTPNSVSSEWVLSEAETARTRGALKPLRVGDVFVPSPFNALHTVLLDGEAAEEAVDRACTELIAAIEGNVAPAANADSPRSSPARRYAGKRILALDGCGTRFSFQVGALQHLEQLLRTSQRIKPDETLANYFDIVGGASFSSILAALVSQGHDIQTCAEKLEIIVKSAVVSQGDGNLFRSKFSNARLRKAIVNTLGEVALCGPHFKTVWVSPVWRIDGSKTEYFSSSPADLLNSPQAATALGAYPRYNTALVDVLEASCAMPMLFAPAIRKLGPQDEALLVDLSANNSNSSAALFAYATRPEFGQNWKASAETLSVLSIGGGIVPPPSTELAKQFTRLPPGLQMVSVLRSNQDGVVLSTVADFQSRLETRKPFFVANSFAGLGQAPSSGAKLGVYQRIDTPLERDYLSRAYGVTLSTGEWRKVIDPTMYNSKKAAVLQNIGAFAARQSIEASDV